MRGGRDVVEADERDVLGHAHAALDAHAHRGERGRVVVREHRVGQRAARIEQLPHRVRRAGIGAEARVDRQLERRIEQHARVEEGAAIAERALRDAVVRERAADERDAPAARREQVMHRERRAARVVDVDRAQAGRADVDEDERPAGRRERLERLRLHEARDRDRVGRVRAHLADHVVGRARRQQRRHDAALAARVLDAVQHMREERRRREVVVLAMQQEREPLDPRTQLRRIVVHAVRDLDDARARRLGQTGLVLERARHGADRHVGRLRNVANGGAHRLTRDV